MRGLWIAIVGAGMMVPVGAIAQAQAANVSTSAAPRMCRADRKAQKKTQKAEAKAARNNAKAAQEQIRAGEHPNKGGEMTSLAVVLTPPPM